MMERKKRLKKTMFVRDGAGKKFEEEFMLEEKWKQMLLKDFNPVQLEDMLTLSCRNMALDVVSCLVDMNTKKGILSEITRWAKGPQEHGGIFNDAFSAFNKDIKENDSDDEGGSTLVDESDIIKGEYTKSMPKKQTRFSNYSNRYSNSKKREYSNPNILHKAHDKSEDFLTITPKASDKVLEESVEARNMSQKAFKLKKLSQLEYSSRRSKKHMQVPNRDNLDESVSKVPILNTRDKVHGGETYTPTKPNSRAMEALKLKNIDSDVMFRSSDFRSSQDIEVFTGIKKRSNSSAKFQHIARHIDFHNAQLIKNRYLFDSITKKYTGSCVYGSHNLN